MVYQSILYVDLITIPPTQTSCFLILNMFTSWQIGYPAGISSSWLPSWIYHYIVMVYESLLCVYLITIQPAPNTCFLTLHMFTAWNIGQTACISYLYFLATQLNILLRYHGIAFNGIWRFINILLPAKISCFLTQNMFTVWKIGYPACTSSSWLPSSIYHYIIMV